MLVKIMGPKPKSVPKNGFPSTHCMAQHHEDTPIKSGENDQGPLQTKSPIKTRFTGLASQRQLGLFNYTVPRKQIIQPVG